MQPLLLRNMFRNEAEMELDNILKLIDAVSESSLTSFSLDDGNIKLTFEADRNEGNTFHIQTDSVNATVSGNAAIQAAAPEVMAKPEEEGNIVKSPLVGIFYSASSPEEEPFVSEGAAVKKGQTLGIIEAMKLMNEIESDYEGTIKKILVENGQMVEFGQPLFVIG